MLERHLGWLALQVAAVVVLTATVVGCDTFAPRDDGFPTVGTPPMGSTVRGGGPVFPATMPPVAIPVAVAGAGAVSPPRAAGSGGLGAGAAGSGGAGAGLGVPPVSRRQSDAGLDDAGLDDAGK